MPENNDDLRPSWVPEEKNPEFACSVMRGIDTTANSITGAKEYPDAPLRKVPLRKKMTVEQYIAHAAKALGGSVKFVDAVRFMKGEGIEKKQEDFAAEVAAQMNAGH